jgi:hypothetical protein
LAFVLLFSKLSTIKVIIFALKRTTTVVFAILVLFVLGWFCCLGFAMAAG